MRSATVGMPSIRSPPSFFRYCYRSDWRGKVRARRHAIPNLVEIVLELALELLHRFGIDSGRPLVSLDPFVCLPDQLLGNCKRLCLAHGLLPFTRLTRDQN